MNNLEDLKKKLQILEKYITLPVDGVSSLSAFKKGEKKEYLHSIEKISLQPTAYLKESFQDGYTKISLKKIQSWDSTIILFLVVVFFLSIISLITVQISNSQSYFAYIFSVPFGIIALTILFGLVFINLKDVNLLYNFREIKLKYSFPIIKFFDKEIVIPKEEILAIRVDRHEHGWFQLSIVLKNPIEFENQFSKFLYSSNLFRSISNQDEDFLFSKKQNKLLLWTISSKNTTANTANYSDLYYLEQKLQKDLRIEEN